MSSRFLLYHMVLSIFAASTAFFYAPYLLSELTVFANLAVRRFPAKAGRHEVWNLVKKNVVYTANTSVVGCSN